MVALLLVMLSSLLVICFCCGLTKLSFLSESFSLCFGCNDFLLFVFEDYLNVSEYMKNIVMILVDIFAVYLELSNFHDEYMRSTKYDSDLSNSNVEYQSLDVQILQLAFHLFANMKNRLVIFQIHSWWSV